MFISTRLTSILLYVCFMKIEIHVNSFLLLSVSPFMILNIQPGEYDLLIFYLVWICVRYICPCP
jgi:hypothetical protein